MASAMSSIAFRREYIHLMIIKSTEQLSIIRICNDLCVHMMVIQILVQHSDHSAIQYTNRAFIQSIGFGSDIFVCIMFDKVVGFVTHYDIWISN